MQLFFQREPFLLNGKGKFMGMLEQKSVMFPLRARKFQRRKSKALRVAAYALHKEGSRGGNHSQHDKQGQLIIKHAGIEYGKQQANIGNDKNKYARYTWQAKAIGKPQPQDQKKDTTHYTETNPNKQECCMPGQ